MARMKRRTIIRIPPLPSPSPMPKSGTISTIDKGMRKPRPAEKFVKIRERINKLGGYAMGGEASESVARSKILKDMRDRKRVGMMGMLDRLYGKDKPTPRKKPKSPKTKKEDQKKFMERPILPKGKPKPKPIRPILPKNFKKPKAKRAN